MNITNFKKINSSEIETLKNYKVYHAIKVGNNISISKFYLKNYNIKNTKKKIYKLNNKELYNNNNYLEIKQIINPDKKYIFKFIQKCFKGYEQYNYDNLGKNNKKYGLYLNDSTIVGFFIINNNHEQLVYKIDDTLIKKNITKSKNYIGLDNNLNLDKKKSTVTFQNYVLTLCKNDEYIATNNIFKLNNKNIKLLHLGLNMLSNYIDENSRFYISGYNNLDNSMCNDEQHINNNDKLNNYYKKNNFKVYKNFYINHCPELIKMNKFNKEYLFFTPVLYYDFKNE